MELVSKPEGQFPAKELETLVAAVDITAKRRIYGSFSQRNPHLGKMVTCIHCHTRHREHGEIPCCTATLVHANENTVPRSAFARRRRNAHHSQRTLVVHQLYLKLLPEPLPEEKDFDTPAEYTAALNAVQKVNDAKTGHIERLQEAMGDFSGSQIASEHVVNFAERVILRNRARADKFRRKQQSVARRVNFGLARPKSRVLGPAAGVGEGL